MVRALALTGGAMPETILQARTRNRILSHMPAEDFQVLQQHLTRVDLPLRKQLEARNKRIEHVYFPESGFASVVADGSTHRSVEVGLVGREGVTGLAIIMG